MALKVHKFYKFYSKQEDHHPCHRTHLESEELLASLKAFRTEVSKFISQLALNPKLESEFLSLIWIERCFGVIPLINKAFGRLVVEIDYPISKWEIDSTKEYLSYSLSLLDLLNSISSSISHLSKARVALSHGLNLFENSNPLARKHLKTIQPGAFSVNLCKESNSGDDKAKIFSGKNLIVHEAVKEMKTVGFWVCGILMSGLCSDSKAYKEMRKRASGFDGSSVFAIDSRISEQIAEEMPILKEVKDINDAVDNLLVASDAGVAKELQTKLRVFEKALEDVSKDVDDLFAKIMTQRTELIDCVGQRKPRQKTSA